MASIAAALVVVCTAFLYSRFRRATCDSDEDECTVWVPKAVVDAERQLVNLFRERHLLKDNMHTIVEEQVAMFLHIVGHNQRFRVVHHTFRRSIETVSRYFAQVLYAVGELRDCIGAIDGTHILARVPFKMHVAFRGRKQSPTQNVLDAIDFDMRFTYVRAGWEGSTHDAGVSS
ncbi:uncharacterized protein LOC105914438 [Setaria italica]|uniref:uncharacterized protein LOC105914438 n=1 Tax=Setaria italica TaxID=4555 RepID=UPI0006454A24|nr:uncharacterized protein LOC105914438 [Setaria italica]